MFVRFQRLIRLLFYGVNQSRYIKEGRKKRVMEINDRFEMYLVQNESTLVRGKRIGRDDGPCRRDGHASPQAVGILIVPLCLDSTCNTMPNIFLCE